MIQSPPSLHGARADGARGVAAAGGLGEAEEAALLAAQHGMQVALLLLLVRLEELGEARRAEHAVAGHVEAGAMLRHLHRHQRARDEIDAGAAVLGGDVEAPEAHLAHLSGEPLRSPRAAARWRRGRAWPRAARSPRARTGARWRRSGAALRWGRGSSVNPGFNVMAGEWRVASMSAHPQRNRSIFSTDSSPLAITLHNGLSRPRRTGGSAVDDRQRPVIGDVQHQQLEMAGRVLLVDLGAEAHGAGGSLPQRALELAAQAEQAAPAGGTDVDDITCRVGQLIHAELA